MLTPHSSSTIIAAPDPTRALGVRRALLVVLLLNALSAALKVSVGAPPQAGRANEAVAKLLAETFGVKVDTVQLVGGDKNREKRFLLAGLDEDAVREALERALDEAARRPGGSARNR